ALPISGGGDDQPSGIYWYAMLRIALILLVTTGCVEFNASGYHAAKSRGDMSHGPVPRADFRADLVAACGAGGRTARGVQEIARAPYLQRVADRSAEILWTTASAGEQQVELSRPGSPSFAVIAGKPDPAATDQGLRRARLLSLEPQTIYCYSIRDSAGVLIAKTGFRTAPPPSIAKDEVINIAVMGDLGYRTPDQAAVLKQIVGVPLDLVLLTGDIAYPNGTLEELDYHFFPIYAQLMGHIPFVISSGNHDRHTADGDPLRKALGFDRLYYSVDWGPLHLVVIDSDDLGAEQLRWLDADLAANRLPWVIAIFHRPPYSAGYHGGDSKMRERVSPILRKHRVPLAVAGHEHNYERTKSIGGVVYLISGGGGRGTRSVGRSWFTEHSARVAHFTHITISGDTATLRAVDATGQMFDSAIITR
ncbi:MAG: metallophosphoesterase, partial [Myxococcota bacterium]